MPSRAERSFPTDLGIFGLPGDVSPRDIRFDPGDARHLAVGHDGRGRVRVWAEADLEQAWLVARHGGGRVTGRPMTRWSEVGRFGFWETELDAAGEPFEYSFAFRSSSGRPVYLAPSGITTAIERLDRWRLDPEAVRRVSVPGWARGAVIYQIFPDRFALDPGVVGSRLDPGVGSGFDPWGAAPHPRRLQGGHLDGVTDRLGHLEALGVDLVYLNPVFTSPSNHRYDAVDYYQVDPALGGNAALARLLDQAQPRGMRVILDASLNHVHPRFFAFQDLLVHGRRSAYLDWFVVRDWPIRLRYRPQAAARWVDDWLPLWAEEVGVPVEEVDGEGPALEPTYEAWYGVPTMPRVDLSHPEARAYMLDVAAYWVREHGIDGWRMDVARYVDPDFWNDFRRVVKAANPEAYLLCEVMGDAGQWLQGDRFDATMNYTFRDIALGFFARDELDGQGLLDHAARLLALYSWETTLVNQNLIGSHDTPRFLTEAGGEEWRLRLATVFQLTFPGAPGIYYGDEVGLAGGEDPGSRGAFPWEPDPSRHPVAQTIGRLTAIRRRRPELVEGGWRPLVGRGGLVAYERVLERRRTLVVINRGRRAVTLELPRRARVGWGEGSIEGRVMEIPPRQAALAW